MVRNSHHERRIFLRINNIAAHTAIVWHRYKAEHGSRNTLMLAKEKRKLNQRRYDSTVAANNYRNKYNEVRKAA